MKYRKVLCAGTFDHYHLGHQFYLWQGIALAKEMVVIVARDETVEAIKGHRPSGNLVSRTSNVKKDFQNHKYVTIRPGREDRDFHQTIREEAPDIIFLGYDQRFNAGKAQDIFPQITFMRCDPYFPDIFKSSYFRKKHLK